MKMGKVEKSLILDSYIRRRKSTQNPEISEKQKKREALRRVRKFEFIIIIKIYPENERIII